MILCFLLIAWLSISCGIASAAAPAALETERATVVVTPDQVMGKLAPTLFGANLNLGDKKRIADPDTLALVRKLRLGSIRFPNGCQADLYDWQSPGEKQVTVDEFLAFCDAIGAEPYYTINLQGGTENLEGPIPEGAPLDERIKYRHAAPNPCGNTNYYFGTLDEAKRLVQEYTVNRALAGMRPLLFYEMGNENWGQAGTDWPPDVYARTIEVYATAMRRVLEQARKKHPELAKLKLHITAVGYPVMGNNQKMTDTPDYRINSDWTQRLNDLHRKGIIDAVQEHFYPYGSADGGTLAWVNHNFANILDARLGVPNPRLGGYKDPKLVYTMPIEFTEWNVKCWGTPFTIEKFFDNPDFEEGLAGWQVSGEGTAMASPQAARRGELGLLVASGELGWCEVTQKFGKGEFVHASFGIWARADNPSAVRVFVREVGGEGKQLGEPMSPPNPDMWQRVVVGGKMEEDVKDFELVLRVEGKATAYFDEAIMHSLKTTSGLRPPSCETFEQQLFCVDALRLMAEKGSQRAHLHHLFGTYPCGLINSDGTIRDNYRVFEFFGGFVGDRLVKTTCKAGTYRFDHSGRSFATDFNALAPTVEKVPGFSAQASRTNSHLFLLMINRYPDRDVEVDMDLGIMPKSADAAVRVLSGTDIDLLGCEIEEKRVSVARRFKHRVASYSAEILALRVK